MKTINIIWLKYIYLNTCTSSDRFLVYHTVNTNLMHEDRALFDDCRLFIEFLGSLQKCCSKQVSKEITQKRYVQLFSHN